MNDQLQAIRVVRAYAEDWGIDPKRIGAMGFSAGAELTAPAAVKYDEFDKANDVAGDPLAEDQLAAGLRRAGLSGPDAVSRRRGRADSRRRAAVVPRLRRRRRRGSCDWADEYFAAFLRARIPNLEMHIYGNGRHPGDPLPEGGTHDAAA